MKFLKKVKRGIQAVKALHQSKKYLVNDVEAKCTHCGCEHFEKHESQLSTPLRSLIGIDWTRPSVALLMCLNCGFIMWLGGEVKKHI